MEFTETAFRPLQEANSLLLRLTQGCTYNACHFCYTSRGHDFLETSSEHLEGELLAKKPFHPADTNVYMIGANPLALPFARLKSHIELLRKHFPRFRELGMQAMIRDVKGKSREELEQLRALGLRHLYIGTENGNDDALRLMNKGHTADEAAEQLLRLDQAGIEYTTQYILGMAGRGQGEASARATAALFNRVHPRRLTTTGLTVFPGTPLAGMVQTGAFTEASEKEKVEELLVFFEHLTTDTFFDSVHYLNPLTYRFSTALEKEAVMDDIRDFLATHSEEEIEFMVGRSQMRSL